MKPRFIEYYEYRDIWNNSVEISYYFMPVDKEAEHKTNMDSGSLRIWRYDTKLKTLKCIRNKHPSERRPNDISAAEFLKIQLQAKEVPYDEHYLNMQRIERRREDKAKK